jgi:hypothetical protein|tara:strand:+ start:1099 stop:1392 length:294 start_codon:yes stop_codon:yes gene_type:complete
MELTKKEKKKLKYTSDVIRLDKKELRSTLKEYVRVLKSEMNILSDRMLDDKSKGMDFHSAIWALKYRVDEIEGRTDDRKESGETSSGAGSSDTKVSK